MGPGFESLRAYFFNRRDGRVVDCIGLENRRTERYRGFESLSLRSQRKESAEKSVDSFFFILLAAPPNSSPFSCHITMNSSISILRVAFTIVIINKDSKLRVLTVKSSVVNGKSYIHP